jgi:cyclin H
MTEDEIYRSSSQYRLWSFTPEALKSLRDNTNAAAAARVKAAIKRKEARHDHNDGVAGTASNDDADGSNMAQEAYSAIECLTPYEEGKLVQYYCSACISMSDSFDFPVPINVKVYPSSGRSIIVPTNC